MIRNSVSLNVVEYRTRYRLPVDTKGFFTLAAFGLLLLFCSLPARAATNWTVLGWNNLGMHCMDADYSVFSILPPYNTISAQLLDPSGRLVTNAAGFTLTYEAVADTSGSINSTSNGKTGFWQFVLPIFGLSLPVDVGLPVPGPGSYMMPGSNNVPQAMAFENAAPWFAAYGIPLTPYDDTLKKNAYPMMRLVARNGATLLAAADIVLPVSDEMDCRACHASGASVAAQPAAGWVFNANPQRDYRLNILRRHDDNWRGTAAYTAALLAAGYRADGLYANVVSNNSPILCAACHLSEALPGSGQAGIPPLTQSVHWRHASAIDPANGLTLEASANRTACYRCHPGSATKCLRGVMGRAVAVDGTLQMQCQSCHSSMTTVGATNRVGWLMEPNCQACHTGDALNNNGQLRFTSAFSAPGVLRTPVNPLFATSSNAPAAGLSLYRFSRGHGGLYCESCHGSTHAEFPSVDANDNLTSIQHQGHVGMLVECDACHGTQPNTVSGGPHGMHPIGAAWVNRHSNAVENSGAAQCRGCHGLDYRGTVFSRAQANRTISAFGTKVFWRGFQIGCYTCHNGPGNDNANPNKAPVASNATATTATNTPVAIPLAATDANKDALTLRIVSQPAHGTVAFAGTVATYFPDPNYTGGDTFTFAANDGATDSNLGTVSITVGSGGCAYALSATSQSFTALGGTGSLTVNAAAGCTWAATTNAAWLKLIAGASGTGRGTVRYTVAKNGNITARVGTLTVAGQTFTVNQAASRVNLTGSWSNVVVTVAGKVSRATVTGWLVVNNIGQDPSPRTKAVVYLSADNQLTPATDTLLRNLSVLKINPGSFTKLRFFVQLPAGVTTTGKYLIAVVDPDQTTPDYDEDDNIILSGPLP